MKKCNKCDERGMINDSKEKDVISAHSCKCGKNLKVIEKLSGYKNK